MTDSPIIEDDYDNIPDELQERRQWLHWDASADTPRRPHWNGDFGVSWTDPNDWHTFEEAVELTREHDSWGIGYVFSDLGPYTFIDLDGCVNDRGGPKDWLPSTEPFNYETYIERSASGTGLHVILKDFEEPSWWSDCHFSDDEHEGVEVYEQKFCAFTGSPIDVSAERVGSVDATDWLVEAYKSIKGTDPTEEHETEFEDAGTGGRAGRDEFLDEDDIRDALSHIDPDVSYPTWRDIGFALKDFFGSSHTALQVFREWSRSGSKWDRDAEDRAERIIKDATTGGGRTIGTVIYHAKQGGWDVPTGKASSGPTSSADIDPDEVDRAEAILQSQTSPDDPVGDLAYHNGGYGIPWNYKDEDGNVTSSGVDQVCNFTMETLSFLKIENQPHDEFKIRVHPNHPTEEPYDVRIAPAVFNSSETFRSEVVTGRTTWFDPGNRKNIPTTTILRYLRETVGAQPAPHRTGQPYIGLSQDGSEFVTPAGSLTADGWAEDPSYEYYSIGGDNSDVGPFGQKWALDPENEVEIDDETVARICELLPNTRKPARGLPIYGWFYAAPLKALIHQWELEFPMLSPHGDTGTGKTSTLETFLQAFGGTGEPLSSTDTPFSKEKHLAESRGFPVWIDEYKPTEMTARSRDHLHQRLKEVTKERTMPKGRPDLGMDQLHMRAPVILSGEQKIGDAAVRRRSILTNLAREPTLEGTDTKAAFGELTGVAYEDADGNQHYPDGYDLRHHARAYYEWVLEKETDEIREWWNEARETATDILDDFGVTLEPSEQRGLQTVVFGVELARRLAIDYGADESELPTQADVRAACEHVIENIGKEGQRREHSDELLEVMSLAATEEYLEPGVHHRVLESQTVDGEVLAVHMPSAFPQVKRYVRDSNLEEDYTLLQRTDYLNSFRNKADVEDSYVIETNKRTRGIDNGGRAVHFERDAIREKLGPDFNIDAFRPPEERGGSEGNDDATPIADLSPEGNPYDTVTVTVETIDSGPDGTGIDQLGTVTDATGVIDVVVYVGSFDLEEGESYRLEDVRVSTYDGAYQLELVENITTAHPIQQGSGHTQPEDPGGQDGSQTDLDSATDHEAAADGGVEEVETPPEQLALQLAVAKANEFDGPGIPRDELVEMLENRGVESDRAERIVENHLEAGELYTLGDGRIEKS